MNTKYTVNKLSSTQFEYTVGELTGLVVKANHGKWVAKIGSTNTLFDRKRDAKQHAIDTLAGGRPPVVPGDERGVDRPQTGRAEQGPRPPERCQQMTKKYPYGFDHTTAEGQRMLMAQARGLDPELARTRFVDTTTPGDHGADPLGDGTFHMVPSGDVVDLDERNRRLDERNRRLTRLARRDNKKAIIAATEGE